jgi:hypothetical protein
MAPAKRGPARRVALYQGVMPLHQSAMVGRNAAPLVSVLFWRVPSPDVPARPD